jgi:hypothetical protein
MYFKGSATLSVTTLNIKDLITTLGIMTLERLYIECRHGECSGATFFSCAIFFSLNF